MKILGLYDGHNAGATILDDTTILASIEEERLSRIKFHDGRFSGLPQKSLDEVFRVSAVEKEDIDLIAVPLESPKTLQKNTLIDLLKQRNPRWALFWIKNFGSYGPLYYLSPYFYQQHRKKAVEKFLKKNNLGDKKILWMNHHLGHNASAYFTSGMKDDVLAISFDGRGDGLCGQAYVCSQGKMTLLHETSYQHSIGFFYSIITEYLGFKPVRHEGKITGLAAYGNPKAPIYDEMENAFSLDGYDCSFDLAKQYFTKPYPWLSSLELLPELERRFAKYHAKREDIAAALQRRSEEVVVEFVRRMIKKTGIKKLALSGGVFSNVKINQRISELSEVEDIFIHPAMTDGGLSLGAAFYALSLQKHVEPITLTDVYFGPGYNEKEIEESLNSFSDKITFAKKRNIEKETATLISEKKVVGRFDGRMEYGPRALGNRSILYRPTEKKVNDWLNKRLKRTEFMPFAPSALVEHRDDLYNNLEKSSYSAQFMTISCDVTSYGIKKAPAVTHVDNTARPQLVTKESNESYYKILRYFKNQTQIPCMVNTSFNMHEEPIVCTPRQAIQSFLDGRLDVLSIGNFIAKRRK